MFDLHLIATAETELDEAFEWYEEQLPGLGIRFCKEVNYYLSLVESNPYLFAIKYRDELRAATLNKFPYLVIFFVDDIKRCVYVTSIFHTSRKPKYISL